MDAAAPDETSLAQLILANHARNTGLYTDEHYAIVARACCMAQALQIGISAGIVSCHPDTQAAFFVSLGIPGRPLDVGMPVQIAPTEAEASSVNQPPGRRRRRPRRHASHSGDGQRGGQRQ